MEPLFLEFIESLNKLKVKYLLVGGQAVILHGYIRTTKDCDVLIENSRENVEKALNAIADFFGSPIKDKNQIEDFYKTEGVFFFGNTPYRIDILKQIQGVEFKAIYPNRIELEIDGIKTSVIDIDSLIQNKKTVGRYTDLTDVEKLEAIKKNIFKK